MKLPLRAAWVLWLSFAACLPAEEWPQFRGRNGSGLALAEADAARYPERFGREAAVLWMMPLPPGISSPCVTADRIYLTAVSSSEASSKGAAKLVTLALDRANGKAVWERSAPADRTEEVHQIGSPATPTPASDGALTHVFFGSYGLLCYDRDGGLVWTKPLGPFKNNYGQASSPVIVGERLLLNCDQDVGSFLLALDRRTGAVLWENPRPEFPRGFSTPIVWIASDGPEVVVAGTLRLVAYNLEDGKERWSVRGLARIVNTTPVLGGGLLFVASYAPGGDADDRIAMPAFAAFAGDHDADKNGRIELAEVPEGPFRSRFPQLDADKDAHITAAEWDAMGRIFEAARNSLIAVKPGGRGDVTDTHVIWRYERATPYVPSPLYHQGLVYMVKDGAIFTCIEAATGKLFKQGRLPAAGNYYASPVATADRILTVSRDGGVCFIRPGAEWEVLATAELGETCMATPALADGKVYLRTEKRLYCFGTK